MKESKKRAQKLESDLLDELAKPRNLPKDLILTDNAHPHYKSLEKRTEITL